MIRSVRITLATFVAVLCCNPANAQPIGGFNRPVDKPAPRIDRNSQLAHEQLVAKAKQGGIDVYFLGDSITRRWGATDYPELLANWNTNFFGWGADNIENILWRLASGELDGAPLRRCAGFARDSRPSVERPASLTAPTLRG